MPAFSEKEHRELTKRWLAWLWYWQNGNPVTHGEKQAVFLDMAQRFGRPIKSYERKTHEYSACAVWLGFGPVLGFPGCPTQKALEPVPEGFELTPDEVEKLKNKDGENRFMQWHGSRSATRKAVENAANRAGIEMKPINRAPKPERVKK